MLVNFGVWVRVWQSAEACVVEEAATSMQKMLQRQSER